MDFMNQEQMTVNDVIKHNHELLRSIRLSPDQREEYGKLCSVIDNNNACIEAMSKAEMERVENEQPADIPADEAVPVLEVKEDAVSEAE